MTARQAADGPKRRRGERSRLFDATLDVLASPVRAGPPAPDDDDHVVDAAPAAAPSRPASSLRHPRLLPLIEPGRRTAPDEPVGPTRAGRPAAGRRRALVLALAGVTAASETASVARLLPDLTVGGVDLSIALIPALVLAVACGSRLLGRSTARPFAAGYWVLGLGALPILGWEYWRIGRGGWFPALLLAALGEELIYRLAIPAVIAAALRIGRVRPDLARIAGLAGAGMWFVLLPGHREQMGSAAGALPFVAFAALSAFVVYRSGSILPMALAHALSNLLTVLMWQDGVSSGARSAALATVLIVLVIAYGRPSRLTLGDDGEMVDTRTGLAVEAIDLRDGRPATVELSDGTVLNAPRHVLQVEHTPLRDLDHLEAPVPHELVALAERARYRLRHRHRRHSGHDDGPQGPEPVNLPVIDP